MNREYLLRASDLDSLPRALPEAPRVAARIKDRPADFVVEEVPAYLPAGEGSHLFLWVEKRDCSGGDLLRRLAAVLGIPVADIGYAGTKDRRAVTRQWLSVPESCERVVSAGVALEGVRVLGVAHHRNKLRLGHLRGNRFRILLRGADPAGVPDLARTAEDLTRTGFPNFFGVQRFGRRGESIALGLDLLAAGTFNDPAFARVGRFERRMALSAVQSALFNLVLRERMVRGLARTVLAGDILARADSGGPFEAVAPEVEQARLDAGEVVLTGPVFGHRSRLAAGEAGAIERAVLAEAGLDPSSFRAFTSLARGTRRPFHVRPEDVRVEADPAGIVLSFFLPKGTYASVMLREFVLPGAEGPAADLASEKEIE